MDKSLIANRPKSPDSLLKSPVEVPVELSSMNPSSMPNLDSSQFSIPVNNGMDLNSDNPTTERNTKVAGIIPEPADPQKETKGSDTNSYSHIPSIDHGQELLFPNQRSKRARDTQEIGKKEQDDRNVLKRSGFSAFSRYEDSQAPLADILSVQNFEN